MKQILLFTSVIFFATSNIAQAQDVVINPNEVTLDTIFDFASDPFPQYISTKNLESNVFNNENFDIELKWEVVQLTGPIEWETSTFVNEESGSHFAWGVLSNTSPELPTVLPFRIEANNSSILELKLRPKGIAGCGDYEIRLSFLSDTTNIITTGIFHFRINVDENCNELVATEDFNQSTAKIFPNPTTDYFTITENPYVESIEIFNIVGKQMTETSFQNGDAINISNFPNGLYLVRMLDNDGDVLKTTRLTKR